MIVNYRLIAIIRKEFIQIWRDPRTLALILVMPLMQLILLGYVFKTEITNLPMAVFDQDRGPGSRNLLDAYRAADYFEISFDVDSEDEINALIDSGDVSVGLIIPPNYSSQIRGDAKADVIFVIDGSDPTVASSALAVAQQIGLQHSTRIQSQRLNRAGLSGTGEMPLEIHTQIWFNPDMIEAYFMVPGVIGFILFGITSILTATTIVRERERGTIEQLIVTPIRSWELVVGKLIPYVILALFDTVTILVFGSWLFKVPIRGDLGVILLLSTLFLATSLSIGMLISTVAKTQMEAFLFAMMTLLPGMFLSGFLFPLGSMPIFLQWISYLMPLRYYLVIIRSLMLKGVSMASLQTEIIALTIFGVVLMIAAALRFRKRLD